jgi:drug/metabolite transporter (DMT)-like permease
MARRVGQWLRLIGLVIEFVGVIGVVRERGGQPAPQFRLPSGSAFSSAWAAVGLGFVLWIVATILLSTSKPTRSQ